MKCPRRRSSAAPPAQCTMNARRMMARMTTTSQKKNTTIPGIAYPATALVLVATAPSYPPRSDLFRDGLSVLDALRRDDERVGTSEIERLASERLGFERLRPGQLPAVE